MGKVIARALYQDRYDVETYEFRIESVQDEGFILYHGIAGRDDLETGEFFTHEYILRSMLPTPYPQNPSCNAAVDSLMRQWRLTMVPHIDDLKADLRRHAAGDGVFDDLDEYRRRRQKTATIRQHVEAHPEDRAMAAVLARIDAAVATDDEITAAAQCVAEKRPSK